MPMDIRLDECKSVQLFTHDWKRILAIDLSELDLTDKDGNPTNELMFSFDTFEKEEHKRRLLVLFKPPTSTEQ